MTSQNVSDNHSRPQVQVQLQVLSVIRRKSPALPTTRYTYNDKGESEPTMTIGAEWEEVEFTTIREEKPTIQISNVIGSIFLPGNVTKLFLNDPDLFGTYKAGDIINFTPIPRDTQPPPENNQSNND